MRTKSCSRAATPLSDYGLVSPTMRQDQRIRVRIGQQTVPKRVRDETRKLRVSTDYVRFLIDVKLGTDRKREIATRV